MRKQANRKLFAPQRRAYLRKQATYIVSQLPDEEEECLYILRYALKLVHNVLHEEEAERPHLIQGGKS